MEYRLPTLDDKKALQDFLLEYLKRDEKDVMLYQDVFIKDYEEWLIQIKINASSSNETWGKSLFYLCIENDILVGFLCIRYELSDEQAKVFGHIGYSVRPTLRRQGYGTQILLNALEECKKLGMQEVILGCFKANIASAKLIQKCGGVLFAENQNYEKGKTSLYYKIALK